VCNRTVYREQNGKWRRNRNVVLKSCQINLQPNSGIDVTADVCINVECWSPFGGDGVIIRGGVNWREGLQST